MHASQKLACAHHLNEIILGSSLVNEKMQRIKFMCLQVIRMLYTLLPATCSGVRPPLLATYQRRLLQELGLVS